MRVRIDDETLEEAKQRVRDGLPKSNLILQLTPDVLALNQQVFSQSTSGRRAPTITAIFEGENKIANLNPPINQIENLHPPINEQEVSEPDRQRKRKRDSEFLTLRTKKKVGKTPNCRLHSVQTKEWRKKNFVAKKEMRQNIFDEVSARNEEAKPRKRKKLDLTSSLNNYPLAQAREQLPFLQQFLVSLFRYRH